MVRNIEFLIPDEVAELLRKVDLNERDHNAFARTLFLKGLAAEYMSLDDDETANIIENWIEKISQL